MNLNLREEFQTFCKLLSCPDTCIARISSYLSPKKLLLQENCKLIQDNNNSWTIILIRHAKPQNFEK